MSANLENSAVATGLEKLVFILISKKGKGKRQDITHSNADFQTIAGRNKKAFLSDQCKEIAEKNRMRKTRDLFKKIRDTQLESPPRGHFMQRWAE